MVVVLRNLIGIEEFAHVAYANVEVFLVIYDISRSSPSMESALSVWVPQANACGVPFVMFGVNTTKTKDVLSISVEDVRNQAKGLDFQVECHCTCLCIARYLTPWDLELN